MNDCDHNHNDPKDNNITTLTHTYQVKLHDAIGGNGSNVASAVNTSVNHKNTGVETSKTHNNNINNSVNFKHSMNVSSNTRSDTIGTVASTNTMIVSKPSKDGKSMEKGFISLAMRAVIKKHEKQIRNQRINTFECSNIR